MRTQVSAVRIAVLDTLLPLLTMSSRVTHSFMSLANCHIRQSGAVNLSHPIMHSANSHNRGLIDLTASSPAQEPEDMPPSSPLPEAISRPVSRPASPDASASPLRPALTNTPHHDQPHSAKVPKAHATTAPGNRRITDFFGPAASGSGSGLSKRAAEEDVVGGPAPKERRVTDDKG
jgi:hypothetical protein